MVWASTWGMPRGLLENVETLAKEIKKELLGW